ncbi:HD-GYP domain-containing protein [Lichenicoccus roseus]|uniref:HD domain-containing protein n=1 Tax=Lichenicoccus roseus TaxID=2683649 RepID=A0A5R9JEE1_9PROT|nr:HD domain-containing phosphohydrolase [Lichenicoccus roseus]TLU74001.1 HD domain-containing protein [Lichenicoccus roseus]
MSGFQPNLVLVVAVSLSGVLSLAGYLFAFASIRRLAEDMLRPTVGLGDLVKPIAGGMLLGLTLLVLRLGDVPQQAPEGSIVTSVLLAVTLAGACVGAWSARPRRIRAPLDQAELVRRLCVAGDTHEDATARIAVRLALAAGFDPAQSSDLLVAATLHDVGKIGLPSALLAKPGELDADERRLVQGHTRIGHRMLARSGEPMLDLAASIALHHHERWDGTGYPQGIAGDAIPLTSRVVAIAEAFDMLLSERCYKAAWELDEVSRYLARGAGTHFDPTLMELFLADLSGMVAARDGATAPGERVPEPFPDLDRVLEPILADPMQDGRLPETIPLFAWGSAGKTRPLAEGGHLA